MNQRKIYKRNVPSDSKESNDSEYERIILKKRKKQAKKNMDVRK